MEKRAKVLAIGLDSADFDLIWKLQSSGDLPNIQALLARGVWGRVQSPPGLGDDGVWASFSFAEQPGEHGRYFWQGFVPDSLEMKRSPELAPDIETFWATLSREGYNVGVIDVPKSPLAELPHGMQIADWLVHGRDGKTRSYPAHLAAMLTERFGHDVTDDYEAGEFLCCEEALPALKQEPFLQALLKSLDSKRQASLELFTLGEWDLFLTVFKECHCVGHEFWHSVDAKHERHQECLNTTIPDPVSHIYRKLDAAIGELIQQADASTAVMVFSGLGMQANYTAEHCLDDILLRLEQAMPTELRDKIHALPKLNDTEAPLQRVERLMLQIPHNEMSGAIKLNIALPNSALNNGALNEAQSIVVDQWCHWLEKALLALVNPNNGKPIVKQVIRSDQYFFGARRNMLPDLFVVWQRSASIDAVASDELGVLNSKPPVFRSGNHIADGFYMLAGSMIDARGQGNTVSITDLGPTIASLLGSKARFADGQSILECLGRSPEPA